MDNQVRRGLVSVGPTRIAVTDCGSGQPILLVHGLGGPAIWSRVREPLSEKFRVVTVDLPGFGKSDPPPLPCPTHHYAEMLDRVIAALGLDHLAVAGISYGGQIAATAALEYPGRIEKLILIASTGISDHPALNNPLTWFFLHNSIKHLIFRNVHLTCFFGKWSFFDLRNRPPDLCSDFLSQFNEDEKIDSWLGALRNTLVSDPEWIAELKNLLVPALIVWGKEDRLVPPADGVAFSRSLPHASLVVLDGCGHSLPLEKPVEMVDRISSFVAG